MIDTTSVQTLLSKLIALESVSTDPKRFSQILATAEFLQHKLTSLGFEISCIKKESVPPLLIASRMISPSAKTIGIYGHYDVQPEDPIKEWHSDPFTLTLRDGKYYGRGVADNKGHVVQNISAIESLIKRNELKNNVIFIFEGEEEVGSSHFESMIQSDMASHLNKIDVFYITDTEMYAKNIPQIFYALRGLVYFELSVQIGERDLHSGLYGNKVLNPVQVIADLFTKIKDIHSNKVLIPKFYESVRKMSASEMNSLKKNSRSDEDEKKEAAVYKFISSGVIPPTLVSKILPSFDVHGIWGGYMGVGSKTVIPKEAHTKFSFRLVEHQDPEGIEKMIISFISNIMPEGVEYSLKTNSKSAPFYTDFNMSEVKQASKILAHTFGNEVVFNRSGGSIPAAEVFQRIFQKPVILTGFTLPDDNIHSPNENFDEEMFWKGIDALQRLYGTI